MTDFDRLNRNSASWVERRNAKALPPLTKRMMRPIYLAERQCAKMVDEILTAYQRHGGFETKAEARTWLETKSDPQTIIMLRREAMRIEDPIERQKFLRRLDSPAYLYRMRNRMAVKEMVRISAVSIEPTVKEALAEATEDAVRDTMLHTTFDIQKGFRMGWSFSLPDERAIRSLANVKWTSQYAKVLADSYAEQAQDTVIAGIMSGASTDRISKSLSDLSGAELWRCKRLARTELSRSSNEGRMAAYDSAGVSRYRFMCTLDAERTCPVCGNLDGQVFETKDAVIGVNMPPIHPNCRCTTVAYFGEEDRKRVERWSRNPETRKAMYVPGDMNYREWLKTYAPEVYEKQYGEMSKAEKMRL